MNKKVTELTEATGINSEDLLMVIQEGENKKAQAGIILNKVNENAKKIESHYIPTNIQEEQGWYLALSGNIVGYDNNAFILSIQQLTDGSAGQLYANIRCNDKDSLELKEFKWLSNTGLNSLHFKLKLDGNNYYLYMRTPFEYGRYQIKVVQATSLQLCNESILTFYAPTSEESVAEPDGINPMGATNYISGSAQPTGETFYGKPIYKIYIEGNVPTSGGSSIILYNCKQILECSLFAEYSGSYFSFNDVGHNPTYNEVRLYNNAGSHYDNAPFKGFITYIQNT